MTATVATHSQPLDVAVNAVTNKIYVANFASNDVTVIDGATNTTATVAAGSNPVAVAVNAVTDKIYVANESSNDVTVIDGATNTTATVAAGTAPQALAVDSETDKIYVANIGGNDVTVIDGVTNATASVTAGIAPQALAVNPVTDKIYVANETGGDAVNPIPGTVTVIDGATNATSTVSVGSKPTAVAVDPATNKAYVVNQLSGSLTVIDGVTDSTVTWGVGRSPDAVAVNPVTDRIYATNQFGDVTVFDGATGAVTGAGDPFPLPVGPIALAVNPVTDRIYVSGYNTASGAVVVIDGRDNTFATVAEGTSPAALAINPVTDKIYAASTANNTVSVIDGPIATTTTVTSSANPSVYGRAVTFTATVTTTDGGGTVGFADGSLIPMRGCQAVPLSLGAAGYQAACVTSTLTPDVTYPITASYSSDFRYAASTGTLSGGQRVNDAAVLTYPLDGGTAIDTTRPFTWSTTPQAQKYILVVGTTVYGTDLVNSGVLPPTQTSLSVPALPVGPTLHATLLAEVNGAWSFQAITFTAGAGHATFTYPTDGQVGADPTLPFTWSTVPAAQGYLLVVGTSQYGTDLANSGLLPPGQSSYTTPSLPVGHVLHATLLTKVNGTWSRFQAITFSVGPARGAFTHPVRNQTMVATPTAFTWSGATGAQNYYLAVGTSQNGTDLVNSGILPRSQTSFNVPALPHGKIVYAALLTKVNGAWVFQAITFNTA